MISFLVRLHFRPQDRQQIAEILQQLTTASRQEPGCVTYIPHTVEAEPDTVLIYEQYRNEAALEAHRGSPHFARWAVGGLYQHMLDRQLEELTALL